MWAIQNIDFRPVMLDFARSEQGQLPSSAVYADDVQLINALNRVAFTCGPVQLSVCTDCGFPGCASGSYVSPRRFADGLILIPSFRELMEDSRSGAGRVVSELNQYQHTPPSWFEERGPAFLNGAMLELLGARVPALHDLERWPRLTAKEFVQLMQWSAPVQMLGEFPNQPRLQEKSVIAVDPGEQEEMVAALDALLARAFRSDSPVTMAQGQPITFYLDQPGIAEWVPMARDGDDLLLANGPDLMASLPKDE